ncbi:unnamed protein product [Linum tenue]|uniref:DUF7733 domain-containing protein n=1 Tax=Linum tenue TaxID=586396 RepID=A0AAV0J0F5_9ROSI|nr:unnamed protein product [Linum tenue]
MSGGVGPSADITLPKDQQEQEQGHKFVQDNELSKSEGVGGGGGGQGWSGRALAVSNMAFWGFNLFGLLLPVAVPICLKKYYAASLSKVSKD